MKYFKRLFSNLKEFKGLIATTIFFNILIVIFTLASTYILIPVLSIIFGENEKVYVKPEYVVDGLTAFQTGGIGGIKEYLTELFNYYMTQWMDNHGVFVVMTWVCILGAFFFS